MVAMLLRRVLTFGRMIKFSHTLFALPFALASAALVSKYHEVTWSTLGWILAAMVGARSAAMGFNRIVDAEFDRRNPRTANREIPAGVITKAQASVFVFVSALLLVLSAYQLNPLCFYLSPLALAIVFVYSLMKRFTYLAHVFLGISLGLAPLGVWMAVSGEWNWSAFLLGIGVLSWVAGFDIIYACQDLDFDRSAGLRSLPVRFGVKRSLHISRVLHGAAFMILLAVGGIHGMGYVYFGGMTLIGLLLYYEQSLVTPNDLSKVNMAFMNMNGIISVLYFAITLLDVFVLSSW